MIRPIPSALCVSLLLLAGCTSAAITWRPKVVSQVPDSTPVRFVRSGEKPIEGVALGWQSGRPRMLGQHGDTVLIPEDARLQVRLRKRAGNAPIGGLVGFVIGIGIAKARCPDCVENTDPTPLLAATVGALIGATIRSYPWVTVKRDAR